MFGGWRSASSRLAGPAVVVIVALIAWMTSASLGPVSNGPQSTLVPSNAQLPNFQQPPPPQVLTAEGQQSEIPVYADPSQPDPIMVLHNPWLLNGLPNQLIPQVLLVEANRPDGWVKVLLPERPNGRSGWIAPGTVKLLVDQYRLVVGLQMHKITVFRAGAPIYSGTAAVGSSATPTPIGLSYIRVLLHSSDPRSVYGPYAYGLSGESEALDTFDGGDAEIGIHGNNDPSTLGRNVTHGCVRMDNSEISQLAQLLPLGTPVEIDA